LKATPQKLFRDFVGLSFKHWLRLIFGDKRELLTDEELVERLKRGDSFFRWGDGETAIARGKSIGYQDFDHLLADKLRLILSNRNLPLISGLCWVVFEPIWSKAWTKRKFLVLFSTKLFLSRNFEDRYFETSCTDERVWWRLHESLDAILNSIAGKRPCLLISSNSSFLNACPSQTHFLEIPASNAFSRYNTICRQVECWISKQEEESKPLILVAAGPTAKAICLDFCEQTQVIDVGHGFDFYVRGFGKWAWTD
jgi:Glycosyltransferase GT-D fold